MKAMIRFGRWRPIVGVLTLGFFAFSLSLEGAPKKEQGQDRSVRVLDQDSGVIDNAARPMPTLDRESVGTASKKSFEGLPLLRGGRLPAGVAIPVAPPVTVNPYDDEPSRMRARGELVGPWRPQRIGNRGSTAAGPPACQFNIECDDCNPCTQDECNILAFDEFGSCINSGIGNGGGIAGCSDGLFSNGLETCQSGACELPGFGTGLSQDADFQVPCNGVCAGGTRDERRCDTANGVFPATNTECPNGFCVAAVEDEDQNECALPCTQGRCADTTGTPGLACDDDGDCGGGGGSCESGNTACDDGLRCNGADTCNVGTGVCEHAGSPCGPFADCSELTCSNSLACNTGNDCGALGGQCIDRGVAGCFHGRCCTPAPNGEFTCAVRRFENAPNGGPATKCTAAGAIWSATATGGLESGNVACPVCAKFSAGVGADPEFDTVNESLRFAVGPVSERTTDLGCSADDILLALGDDYELSNSGLAVNDYIDLEEFVFLGGVETTEEERINIEFYDAAGNFIEDLLFASGSGIAKRSIEIQPTIRIPATGRILFTVATAFSPSGKIFWLPAGGADIGSSSGTIFADFGAGLVTTSTLIGTCSGGTFAGDYCNPSKGNADCLAAAGGGVDGTCVNIGAHNLSFELAGEKAPEPSGACCDTGDGACDLTLPWTCGGIFGGIGTGCSFCSIGGAECRTCTGGANDGLLCSGASDCPGGTCDPDNDGCVTCDGGANDGQLCPNGAPDCPGGSCVNNGICGVSSACLTGACCTAGVCLPTDDVGCAGDFQGFGTDCDPNCCEQPTDHGWDECADVVPVTFSVLLPGQSETVTVTGNNDDATGPDNCTAAQFDDQEVGVEDVDPGWWVGWTFPGCHYMRVDMCCSVPVHAPQWVVMWDSCPCEASHCEGGSNDGTLCPNGDSDCTGGGECVAFEGYFNAEPPDNIDDVDDANNRGAPYCNDDNLWWYFGPLPGGTFYQPVFSALAGAHGAYQMHFTAIACPQAACCFLTCTGGANAGEVCEVNGDCDSGACDPTCELRTILACINDPNDPRAPGVNGIFQAPPFKTDPTTFCTPAVCGTGSCCPAPGVCIDEELGDPVDKSDCDNLNGKYIGGINCFGGTCNGGTRDGLSCSGADPVAECPGGGTCAGTDDELAQLSPCPICDLIADTHCQNDPGEFAGTMYNSSSSVSFTDPDGQARVADDILADENGALSEICVIGAYVSFDGGAHDCSAEPVSDPDDFRVRVFSEAAGGGLPGTLLGESTTTIAARGVEFNDGGFDFYRHKLVLDTPIINIVQNNIYWIEVTNGNTNVDPPECNWFWLNAEEQEGNNYFMQGLGEGFYSAVNAAVPPAGRPDIAICTNIAFSTPPEYVRACCNCDTGSCTDSTFFECALEQKATWLFDTDECADLPGGLCPADTVSVPSNDEAGGAVALSDGVNTVGNRCATDSPAPLLNVDCGGATTTEFRSDTWYNYTSTCDQNIEFSMCNLAVNGSQDTLMAIYTDGSGTCPTTVTPGQQVGICSDDGCFWGGTGPSLNIANNAIGICYVIRIAGFFDDDGAEYLGQELVVTCGAAGGECDPAVASSDGQIKSRHLGIVPGLCPGSTASSIKVTVVTNPADPSTVGDMWFAAAPITIANTPNPSQNGAGLVCNPGTPHSETAWASGNLHLFGNAIAPSGTFNIEICDAAGLNCSAPLLVAAGFWGDTAPPFKATSANEPSFIDISACVDKFKNIASAPNQVSTDIGGPGSPTVDHKTDFADIGLDVDAFKFPGAYPFAVSSCP